MIKLPNDGECAFCAYLRGDREYTILRQDSQTATLVTREQRGKSHLLVIPLRHAQTLMDLTNDEAQALIVAVKAAASLIDQVIKPQGISIWQNNGVPSGQAISHVHFHVAGTLDNGSTERGNVPELSIAETNRIADNLRLHEH